VGGWILLATGTALAFLWFFWMLPLRHLLDYNGWSARHSAKAHWEETQKQIARVGWFHDNFGYVGAYGDKAWAARIIRRFKPGQDISSCGASHKDSALARITNQYPGDSAAAWLAWWSTNQAKTQEQWILDGFRQEGIEIQSPFTKANIQALLVVIGRTNHTEAPKLRTARAWNAARWLRDHEFDPLSIHASDLPADKADAMLRGLVKYGRSVAMYPALHDVGVPIPRLTYPGFRATVCAIILGCFVAGWLCLRFGRRLPSA
jgi:hypothetical protein